MLGISGRLNPLILIMTCMERQDLQPGRACNLVRNISIGLMTVALIVRARAPATSGAGVRVAVTPGLVVRDRDELLTAGSLDPVKTGEMRARRYSYPSM